MTFLKFQKELYYISEGIKLKNSQKDLRRCEGFQKVLYSALNKRAARLLGTPEYKFKKLAFFHGMTYKKVLDFLSYLKPMSFQNTL